MSRPATTSTRAASDATSDAVATSACPGCGLVAPDSTAPAHRYVNASPACWERFTLVLAAEYEQPLLFGACHQRTVDAYIAQHPGGAHPWRSVSVHLVGLCLAIEHGVAEADLPRVRRALADRELPWEGLAIPTGWGGATIADAVPASGTSEHVARIRAFSETVWAAWAHEHDRIGALATELLAART